MSQAIQNGQNTSYSKLTPHSAENALEAPSAAVNQAFTSEQKEAQKIDQNTNDLIATLKDQISEHLKDIYSAKETIQSLEGQIKELEQKVQNIADSTKKAEIQQKINQAKADLENLEIKTKNFDHDAEILQNYINQLTNAGSEIHQFTQAALNGIDIPTNLKNAKQAYQILETLATDKRMVLLSVDAQLASTKALSSKLETFIQSIDIPGNNPNPKPDPTPWSPKGQEAYIDITLLPYWSLMDYSMWEKYPDGIIPASKIETYLNSLFSQMKDAGVNQIDIAFAQFGSIDDLLAAAKWDGDPNHMPDSLKNTSDLITKLMRDFPVLEENGKTTNAFSKFIEMAKQFGMKIDLSVGGEQADSAKICKAGESPSGQAAKFAEFMEIMGIDKIDFDLENAAIVQQNTTPELREFFSEMHCLLSAQGKETTLTTMGSINDWVGSPDWPGQGFFHDMFYDENGNSIFNDMFDNLNLMLYGGDTSYLDIGKTTGWGIEDWLDVIGKENAKKIHIGFEDLINYADTSTNAGHQFDIRPGSTAGEAAAQIFHQIKEKLAEDGYSSDLGNPFWWPEYRGEKGQRYSPQPDGTVDFKYEMEKDFWTELNKLESNSSQSFSSQYIEMQRTRGTA